jgi:hypothetical protein
MRETAPVQGNLKMASGEHRAPFFRHEPNPHSMRYAASCLLLVALAFAVPAHAVSHDEQIWTTVNANFKLSNKWRLSEEIVARFSDKRDGLYEIENNLLLGYLITDRITLWAGYTHDPQYSGGDHTVTEHRAREQVTFDKLAKLAGGSFDARLRMEQRWRNGADGTGWRFRPFIRYVRPFKAGGKTALVVSHEGFINLNSTNFQAKTGYDRMRNFIGISTPFARHAKLEIGYLNQYAFVRGRADTMDHVAAFSVGRTF